MEDIFRPVAVLLCHGEGNLHGIGDALPGGPVPVLVRVCVLHGQLIGLGKVAHVDGQAHIARGIAVLALFHDDGGLAGIHIGIGGDHRQGQGLAQELHGDQVAPVKAHVAHELFGLAVGIHVAVLGHPDVGVQAADGDLAVGLIGRQEDGHAAIGLGILLAHNAAQDGGDIVHDHLVQGKAGVKLAGCRRKGIVGVAAGGTEVIGDDGIGGVFIEGLTVDALDGDAVDALGAVVGGAGIGRVSLVVVLGSVQGQLHARRLGEAAQGNGRAESGRLQRLQQLSAGDIHHRQRVAEGQNGGHVRLGNIPRVDPRANAAAVGDGHGVLHVDSRGLGLDGPHHGIGDKVAQIGLLGAVARLLVAVELHLRLGEYRAVLLVDGVHNGLGSGSHGGVLILILAQIQHLRVQGLLGLVVDQQHAHIGQLRARGLNGQLIVGVVDISGVSLLVHAGLELLIAGQHHGMGVSVDDEVNIGHVFQQVIGGIGLRAAVHTQVGQADHRIRAPGLQRIHLGLGGGVHLLPGQEGQALDQGGVGLGLCLGSLQTEEADLHAALFDDGVFSKNGRAVLADVGAQHLEVCLGHVLH